MKRPNMRTIDRTSLDAAGMILSRAGTTSATSFVASAIHNRMTARQEERRFLAATVP